MTDRAQKDNYSSLAAKIKALGVWTLLFKIIKNELKMNEDKILKHTRVKPGRTEYLNSLISPSVLNYGVQ